MSFRYFVSQSVQRTLENICRLRHRLFAEFGTDCVKNFVKKRVDEVSSVGTTIDEDLRVSHGGRIALSPTTANALACNIMGAIVGGLLEYNSMYFGFKFLYLLAIFFYIIAYISSFSTFYKL